MLTQSESVLFFSFRSSCDSSSSSPPDTSQYETWWNLSKPRGSIRCLHRVTLWFHHQGTFFEKQFDGGKHDNIMECGQRVRTVVTISLFFYHFVAPAGSDYICKEMTEKTEKEHSTNQVTQSEIEKCSERVFRTKKAIVRSNLIREMRDTDGWIWSKTPNFYLWIRFDGRDSKLLNGEAMIQRPDH